MVSKTIRKVLNRKLDDWLKYVDDENMKTLIRKNTIITGGAIVNLLQNEKPKDFDVYFRNRETVLAVANYYVGKFNEKHVNAHASVIDGVSLINSEKVLDKERVRIFIKSRGVVGEEPFEDVYDTDIVGGDQVGVNALEIADTLPAEEIERDGNEKEYYRPVYLSANAITLANKVQIIVRFWGEAEKIHENFDFIHCTCYWSSWDNNLELPAKALEAIMNKQLIYQGSRYPICSLMRMRKFISRGFTINAGQILKVCYAISNLDLTDIAVLEDQLTGVDSAYFNILITQLQKKTEDDPNFKIDENYVCTIVDKLFG
jgi:hypothetical protein